MIDFKYLVKVNPNDPLAAARKLGQLILNNENAFSGVDATWIAKQDYITALPVAIALTVEMRAVVQANSPDTKFIVTGVTSANVADLVTDFDYKVYHTVEIPNEKPVVKEDQEISSGGQATDGKEIVYYYNGKKVKPEEWQQHHDEFLKAWNDVWSGFGEKFLDLF